MIPSPLPETWRRMAAEAATLADDLGFPQLSDRMERLSMRPFDPQKDVVSREDYDEFQRLYGPIKSIGLSPDGSPMVVVQKGGIDRMYQKDADAAKAERIWFSPHCLGVRDLFSEDVA